MVRLCPSARIFSAKYRFASSFSLPIRQLSSLILLLSLICAPINGIAQSKGQEKRGLAIPTAPVQTTAPVTPVSSGNKPELILQTGHTKSANAVAFSPDNRWLASGGKDNVIKIWDLTTGNVLR
ncbi:MAG: WD40 repeat domain-containing protein, partial [bacterium]